MKSTLDLSGIKKHKSKMKSLESKEVEWGFLEGQHSKADMSYAALAALLEYGSRNPEGGYHIPPRPAFRDLIAKLRTNHKQFELVVQGELSKFIEKPLENPNKLLQLSGQHLVNRYQNNMEFWLVSGSKNTHNAPYTIEMKGFDQPFVETGELIDNVKFKVK